MKEILASDLVLEKHELTNAQAVILYSCDDGGFRGRVLAADGSVAQHQDFDPGIGVSQQAFLWVDARLAELVGDGFSETIDALPSERFAEEQLRQAALQGFGQTRLVGPEKL